MRGLTLTLTVIDPIATVTPCYVSEILTTELMRLNDANALCIHCQDGGYIRAAEYETVGTFKWGTETVTERYNNRVCEKHMIDEVENFRDLGK